MSVFEPLVRWQKASRKSDAQVAALLGISPSKLSRAKRGLHPLPMEDQLTLEAFSGISPTEWAEFYAAAVRARPPRARPSQKKSPVGKAA